MNYKYNFLKTSDLSFEKPTIYSNYMYIVMVFAADCTSDQFACLSGLCLSTSRRCDGIYDCAGFEDELGCGKFILCIIIHVCTFLGADKKLIIGNIDIKITRQET